MSRGRRAQPDEIKALRGNPGKRKLLLERGADKRSGRGAKLPPLQIPESLTETREIEIFKRTVDGYLQRRIARPEDLPVYARWASYLHQWMCAKEEIKKNGGRTFYVVKSNHGTRLARVPAFKDMLDIEKALQSLEDRLGLNPAARQNLIKGLAAMPAAMGALFGDDPPAEDGSQKPSIEDAPTAEEVAANVSPLGFLQNAGKPH